MKEQRILKFIALFIITLGVATCSDDSTIERGYPRVNTMKVVNITETGATFRAELINESQYNIMEYGFVWGDQTRPTTDNSEKKAFFEIISNGNYSADISTTLAKNNIYYVRAYAKTNDYLVYGKAVSFLSLGSDSPMLNDFEPKTGVWGDTVVIKGANFSYVQTSNNVYFKDLASKVIQSTDTTITCIVPDDIADKTVPIYVEIADQTAKAADNFIIKDPIITSISSLTGTFRDVIIITGINFGNSIERNEVYFGNIAAPIIYADKNILKITVPDDLESSSEPIKIISNNQEATSPGNFTLIPPEITHIPAGFYTNTEVTFTGKFFHPVISHNKITIENIHTDILSNDIANYTVKIPEGPFTRRKAIVKVQVLDLITEYEMDIDILDKWILADKDLPFRYYGAMNNAVVANGDAYLITFNRDIYDDNYYLWKFDQNNFSWQQSDTPFNSNFYTSDGIVETDGTNIYVYLSNSTNDFWEYNTSTATWSQKSSFIGNRRRDATHFSINGDIYVGLGIDSSPYIPIGYNDFYKYNPATDQWTQISDVPFDIWGGNFRFQTVSFVINGIGYFTGGAYSTGDVDAWSYDPANDNWAQIADNPYAFQNGDAGFELNGYGYVTGAGYSETESWRYDPVSNEWIRDADVGTIARNRHFAFSLNGRGYTGGGGIYGGGSNGYDFYEFVP